MKIEQILLGELETSFQQGDVTRRGDIVCQIGQLFVSGAGTYSLEQIDLFGEVLTRLVDEIGDAARAELSRNLSLAPTGPSKLLRRLALDDSIHVAEPLLSNFAALDEKIQVECADSCGNQHLLALTRRTSLSEAVTAPLIARGDAIVLKGVVGNRGAYLSDRSYRTLVERAQGDDELILAIGTRPDLPRHHFLRLLQVGSELVRRELQAADPQNTSKIQKVVSQIAAEIADNTIAASDCYAGALEQVRRLHVEGKLDESAILGFITRGEIEQAIAALACLSQQQIADVEDVIRQERFEPILILARSLGLGWPTARALLNLQAGITGLEISQVDQALAVFERTDRATAERVLMIRRRSKYRSTKTRTDRNTTSDRAAQ